MKGRRKSQRSGEGSSSDARNVVPLAMTVAAVAVFSFLSGGYIIGRNSPVAIVYLLIAAVWVWFLRRSCRPPVLQLVALAVFGLFVAWTGLSVLWSFGPDLSWIAFNLAAFYLAVAALLGLTPVRRLHLRVTGYAFLATAAAVGVYAFLGKGLPDFVTHANQFARLSNPVGYWNVLALLMALALPVALAIAADRSSRVVWRVMAAAGAVPMCFTFFFALSRGGWVALVVVLALYFAFSTTRLSSLASLVAIVAPVAVVLWRLRGLETLYTATPDAVLRASQGYTLLVWSLGALAVTVAVQALIAVGHTAVPWPRRAQVITGAVVLVVLVGGGAVGSWSFLEERGGTEWARERIQMYVSGTDDPYADEGAARLGSVNTGRPPLWREALDQSEVSRLSGTGAGTFPFTHYRFRDDAGVVKHAHSQWFNVLSELGVVGLSLLVAALALLCAAAIGNPFADRGDPSRSLLVALQAGMIAFLVHISWDWDWDMAAIGTVFFLFAGVCSAYLGTRRADARALATDREHSESEEPLVSAPREHHPVIWPQRVVISLALVLLAASWAFPYLSARAESAAFTASSRGDTAAALEHAQSASRLNPLAVAPLITQAQILQQSGRNREALDVLRVAAALQPDNYEVYQQLGVLYLKAFDRRRDAVDAFARALALNPKDYELQRELAAAAGR
jgi:Flp pilus assembly protein TadD